jgi:transposase
VAIALNLELKSDTVRKVWNYYEETGRVSPPPRSGRPPILTDRDRRHLKRHVKANRGHRRQALSDITTTLDFNVSERTLCNELQKINLNHRVARKKPWLRPAQKFAHLEFEKKYGDWDFDEWTRAIWTDEMAMQTASNGGKVYVWREPDEEYEEDYVEPTFIPGFKRIKVWGAV